MKVYVSSPIRAGDFVSINRFRVVAPFKSAKSRGWLWRLVMRQRVLGFASRDLPKGFCDEGEFTVCTGDTMIRVPVQSVTGSGDGLIHYSQHGGAWAVDVNEATEFPKSGIVTEVRDYSIMVRPLWVGESEKK